MKTASERRTVVKFPLEHPKIEFGGANGFTLLDAKVWRITDVDLRRETSFRVRAVDAHGPWTQLAMARVG